MENHVFKRENIKTFEWEELEGKTLKIHTTILDGVYCAIGIDTETEEIYLLAMGT